MIIRSGFCLEISEPSAGHRDLHLRGKACLQSPANERPVVCPLLLKRLSYKKMVNIGTKAKEKVGFAQQASKAAEHCTKESIELLQRTRLSHGRMIWLSPPPSHFS